MITASQEFIEKIQTNNRELELSILVNGITITQDKLMNNLSIIYSGSIKDTISIGDFCRSSCTFYVINDDNIDWTNKTFTINIKLAGVSDVIPLGKFWVNTWQETDRDNILYITAYDLPPVFSEKVNVSSRDINTIFSTIESLSGMTITNKAINTLSVVPTIDSDITWIELLGYIAGYNGYSLKATRNGDLAFYKYEKNLADVIRVSPETIVGTFIVGQYTQDDTVRTSNINPDIIFQSQLHSNKKVKVNSYHVIGKDDVELTTGEGWGIEYKNPYIESLSGITYYLYQEYTPLSVEFFGNPLIEVGDIVNVAGYIAYVMEYQINFDGGLKSKIYCYSNDYEKEIVPVAPIDKKFDKVNKDMKKITNHFYTDDEGVHVVEYAGDSETGNNILLDAQGLNIRHENTVLAQFSDTVTIGETDKANIVIDEDSLEIKEGDTVKASFGDIIIIGDKNNMHTEFNSRSLRYINENGQVLFSVIDPRNEDGIARIKQSFYYINKYEVTQKYFLSSVAIDNENYKVFINGEEIQDVTKTTSYFKFNAVLPFDEGTVIEAEYDTRDKELTAMTLGSRYSEEESGGASCAIGWRNTAAGRNSFAQGRSARATKESAFASGAMTIANGEYSHAEGYSTVAEGAGSHTEGNQTRALADYAHAEGGFTIANGQFSHAEGMNSVAWGVGSHASGLGTLARDYQYAIGKYNESFEDTAFEIGNGENQDNRKTVFAIDWDGSIHTDTTTEFPIVAPITFTSFSGYVKKASNIVNIQFSFECSSYPNEALITFLPDYITLTQEVVQNFIANDGTVGKIRIATDGGIYLIPQTGGNINMTFLI